MDVCGVYGMSAWRAIVVLSLLSIAMAAMGTRAGWLAGKEAPELQHQGRMRTEHREQLHALRGVIRDRRGAPLAVSTPVWSLFVDPSRAEIAPEDVLRLAETLDVPASVLEGRLARRDRRFAYLRREVTPARLQAVQALGIADVQVQKEYRRYYPAGELAAHVVGIADIDERGSEGVELAFDQQLQASPGRRRVLRDRRGNVVRELEVVAAAEPGRDIRLALDLRIQHMAFRELEALVRQQRAKAASLVMLDARTGEILAMVNQPAYNPNRTSERTGAAVRNVAVVDVFEPGSTAKPFTVIAALESGQFAVDSTINTAPGYLHVGSKMIEDPRNRGVLSLREILAYSSQVGATRLGLALPERAVVDVLQRVGVGRPPGVGLPGEATGYLPARANLREIERATLSYGYGFLVSPLQLARAYLVLGSGGRDIPVALRRQDRPGEAAQVIDQQIAEQVRDMLAAVVEPGGTATRAQIPGYRVGGKTGTARKLGPEGYDDSRHLSFFAGMAPLDDPRVITVVVVDEAQGGTGGGAVAAPVFSRVVAHALRLLRIPAEERVI